MFISIMVIFLAFPCFAEITIDDVIMAARNNGVQEYKIKQLENFISQNANKFTNVQYADMVAAIEDIATIVKKYTEKDLSTLSENEKGQIQHDMSEEDKQAILNKIIKTGKKVEVDITYKKSDTNFGYDIFATYNGKIKSANNSDTDNTLTNNDNIIVTIVIPVVIILFSIVIIVIIRKNILKKYKGW